MAALALALGASAAVAPKPRGLYVGQLINEDFVQLRVSADGKTGVLTIVCQDTGEADLVTQSRDPQATVKGKFTSRSQASVTIDENASLHHYICFGTRSPAILKLKGDEPQPRRTSHRVRRRHGIRVDPRSDRCADVGARTACIEAADTR